MKKSYYILFLISLFACKKQEENSKFDPIETQHKVIENNISTSLNPNKEEVLRTLTLDSLWNIITQKSSCLTGGQYHRNGNFRREGCVIDEAIEWEILLEKPEKALTIFLLYKLSKVDTTKVHTCPYFLATEGELATYTLQRIYGKNWYDFEVFKIYKDRNEQPQIPPINNREHLQIWLQEDVLQNDEKRETLKHLWLEEMNKN